MGKLGVFNNISLDGYFTDANNALGWTDDGSRDAEFDQFVAGNASAPGALLFGRITYERMSKFWPTQAAIETMPAVAEGINRKRKFVVSRTLDQATWNNTTILKGNLNDEVNQLKREAEENITILGSGTLVSKLAQDGLIDELQLLVNPVVLGRGRTLFENGNKLLRFKLIQVCSFANGKVFMRYETKR